MILINELKLYRDIISLIRILFRQLFFKRIFNKLLLGNKESMFLCLC